MAHLNVLISTFAGLPHKTIAIHLPASTSVSDLWTALAARLPPTDSQLILTTNSNKQLPDSSPIAVSSYLASCHDAFLPLRLSVPLLGGKGGFGSQLRAAGGRMSSRKRRDQGEQNGSSRNLDGRRLRTVTEAKALAEYLAIKPGMESREKEVRRKRWEEIVDVADRREGEMRRRGGLSDKWLEEKEEASERTRSAVIGVLSSGIAYKDNLIGATAGSGSDASASDVDEEQEGGHAAHEGGSSNEPTPPLGTTSEPSKTAPAPRPATLYGFDEHDEFMSSDEENGE